MKRVIIRIQPGEAARWRIDGNGSVPVSGYGTLAELAPLVTDAAHITVLVPSVSVLLTEISLPGGRRHVEQALPYVLEEQLAADVDTLQFAHADAGGGRIAVAVVARDVMNGWLQSLRDAGIAATALVPDVLALPRGHGWGVLCDGGQALVRSGDCAGFACEAENLAPLLARYWREAGADAPTRLDVYAAADTIIDLPVFENVSIEHHTVADTLELFAQGLSPAPFNLLQGRYATRRSLGRAWRLWRPAAVLAVIIAALQLGQLGYDYWQLGKQRDALRVEIENIYRQAFPQARHIVNPRAQMQHALDQARGGGQGSEFLDLFARAGRLVQATPGVRLQHIGYQDGVLSLTVLLPDFPQVDELKRRFSQDAGLTVEVQSAAQRDDHVDARFRLRAGAA